MIDSRKRWLALIVLCMGELMIVLDTTIVNVALPSIREALLFTETSLVWVVNAYMLTYGGFLLLGGRLGDLYGQRRLFLLGIALFTFASVVCGVSNSQGLLIAARAVQGLGGAVVSSIALSLMMNIFTEPRAREGDGHFRLRLRRRRQHRRARRRPADRRAQLALDLPRQSADRRRRLLVLRHPAEGKPRAGRGAPRRRRRRDGDGVAHARGLRDRERQRGRLDLHADARPSRGRGGAARPLPRDRDMGARPADAAASLSGAKPRDGQRGRHPLVRGDVRVVLRLGALHAAGPWIQPDAGRARVSSVQPDHGGVLARHLGEDGDALRHAPAARGGSSAHGGRTRPLRAVAWR